MIVEEMTIEKEISLSNPEYKLYKLREFSSSELRNLYQELLYDGDSEMCSYIKIIMIERNSNL